MTSTIFTNIESGIINELMLARQSIKIAVAWFNSKNILNVLCWKLKGGVKIEIVMHYDSINNGSDTSLDFNEYKQLGGSLIWAKAEKSTMHLKYCIIDEAIVLHGSCNWTYRGFNQNDEGYDITHDEPELVKTYLDHFISLKNKYSTQQKTIQQPSTRIRTSKDNHLSKEERIRAFVNELKQTDITQYSTEYVKSFIDYWTFSVSSQKMRFEEKPDFLMMIEIEDWERKQAQMKEDEEFEEFCKTARVEAEKAYEDYCKYIENSFVWPDFSERLKEMNDVIEATEGLKTFKIGKKENSSNAYDYIKKCHLPAIVAEPISLFGVGKLQSKTFSLDGKQPIYKYDIQPNKRHIDRSVYRTEWEYLGWGKEFGGTLGKIIEQFNISLVEFVTIPPIEGIPPKDNYIKRYIESCVFLSRFAHKLSRKTGFLKKEHIRLLFEANYAIESYNNHCREKCEAFKDITIREAYKKSGIECPTYLVSLADETIGDVLESWNDLIHPSIFWLKLVNNISHNDDVEVLHHVEPSKSLLKAIDAIVHYGNQDWDEDWYIPDWYPRVRYILPHDVYYAREGFRFLSLEEACGFNTEGLELKPLKYYSDEICSWPRDDEWFARQCNDRKWLEKYHL